MEPEPHRTLSELAEREGRSISDLVRESVQVYLVERDRETKREREQRALDRLAELRERICERYGIFDIDLVGEARDERDRDNERVWRGEPFMTEPDRIAIFERWSETYDRSVLDESGVHEGYDQVLETVVRAAQVQPGMRVLDLGIGTGNLAQRFLALGCAVWGVDFSPAMLSKARAKLPEVTLVQADLRGEWPTDGTSALTGPYDRIVSSYVLHEFSLEHKVALLRHLADCCLVPGGRVVIGDISFESVQARTDAGADHWDEEEHYWAADETRAACVPAGLRFTYTQVSRCGGVYVFEPTPQSAGE